jgi:flagellar biosynthesis GTPase FlhF
MTGTEVAPAEVQEFLPTDLDQLVGGGEEAVARARALAESIQVDDEESAEAATALLRTVIAERKAIEKKRVSLTKPRKDAAELIKGRFDEVIAPFKEVEDVLRGTVKTYLDDVERKRQEEQARLDREREERERLEREKREAEEAAARKAQADKEREAQEARELAAEDPELALLAEETAAEAAEATTAAEAISSLPDPTLPRAEVAAPVKPEGAGTSEHWEFEVTDIGLLPDHLPDGTPLKAVLTAALRQYMHDTIKATGKPPEMPGVEFKKTSRLAVRA